MNDYYELLEVHPRASPEVIARAFRVLVARYHPDVHPPERRAWAEEMMKRVNEAFGVLSDPQKRAAFDAERESAGAYNSRPAESQAASTTTTRSPSAPTVAVVDSAMCAFHPSRPRISTCLECRKSICECRQLSADGRPYCRECAAKLLGSTNGSGSASAPVMRSASTGCESTRVRLSVMEWVNAVLATGALAITICVPIARRANELGLFFIELAASFVVAGGVVFALVFTLKKARFREPSAGIHLAVLSLSACILVVGLVRAQSLPHELQQNIATTQAERRNLANERNAERLFVEFSSMFPAQQPSSGNPVSEGIAKGVERFLDKRTGGEPEATSDAGTQTMSFDALPSGQIGKAREKATAFLNTEYSRSHEMQRITCQAFMVWAETKQPTGKDVSVIAVECRDHTQNRTWKTLCNDYLATRYTKSQIESLMVDVKKGNAGAAQTSLSLITVEAGKRLPEEVDNLAAALLDFDKSDLEKLKELKRSYDLARPGGRVSKPIEDAIAPLEAEAQRRAEAERQRTEAERQHLEAERQRSAHAQELRQQATNALNLLKQNDAKGKEEGLRLLTPELKQLQTQLCEQLALKLGEYLFAHNDRDSLLTLKSRYAGLPDPKDHTARIDEWIKQVPAASPPTNRTPGKR